MSKLCPWRDAHDQQQYLKMLWHLSNNSLVLTGPECGKKQSSQHYTTSTKINSNSNTQQSCHGQNHKSSHLPWQAITVWCSLCAQGQQLGKRLFMCVIVRCPYSFECKVHIYLFTFLNPFYLFALSMSDHFN